MSIAADLVFRGGTVRALDEANTAGTAIAVKGETIVAVGNDAEISALIGPQTELVELDGRAVIPGINDSHLHAAWVGATWPWVYFGGDSPAPPRPLATTDEERRVALLRVADCAAAFGITSYTEPGIGPGEDHGTTGLMGTATLGVYRKLLAEGALKQRVNLLMLFGEIDGPSSPADLYAGLREYDTSSQNERRFRVAGIKIFADGVPIARSAYLEGHYVDGSHGRLTVDGADEPAQLAALRKMVATGVTSGFQVAVHATGDRSIQAVIDTVRQTQDPAADLRCYIIHADLATRVQLDELRDLGMGATYQAGIGQLTRGLVADALGAARAESGWQYGYAWKRGVAAALSSDGPFLSMDWRLEVAHADARLGPAKDSELRMLRLLRAWTAIPAWIDHAESWKGTLEPGKVADLVIVSQDPFTLAPAEIPQLGIEASYLGGQCTYVKEEVNVN